MALASQFSHKLLLNTALPYKTFTSPIDQDPQFVGGRNVMINSKAFCAMRPGFADYLEPVPTTFNHLMRFYSWARWDGTYFVMAVDKLPTGQMAVYKFQVGSDSSFVRILTEMEMVGAAVTTSGVPFSFTVANNYLFISNPTECHKWSPDHGLQNWGILAPSSAPAITLVSSGSLTATSQTGYSYVVTYVNSVTGHESSPSPLSAWTGAFTSKNISVSWTTSTDPQVDKVNIYRTTDGGARNPQEMGLVAQVLATSSPYVDSTQDSFLSAVQFAPAFYQNDPPPAMASIISYAGRIWGIVGTRVWYSGQEEISNGVPQECFLGASVNSLDGNFYAYAVLLSALAPLSDGVAVFGANRIEKIEGDSLDTFRRYTLLAKRGTLTDLTTKVVGSSVIWFDRAKQLWLSDQGEIGKDIRPDLSEANLLTVQAAIHIAGEQHWICLLDPDNSLLYVFDLDVGVWNVPWSVAATTIESIDTAPGITRLVVGVNGTKVMLENPNLFLDGAVQYGAYAVTNPLSLAPDSNPDVVGYLHHVAVESNQYPPYTVSVKTDDDPGEIAAMQEHSLTTGFNQLNTVTDPPLRSNGQYLLQKNYMGNPDQTTPACRRLAVRLDWTIAESALWALYSIDLAMMAVGK